MIRCLLLSLVLLLQLGCSGPKDEREVVRFWAMGREGEMVAKLLPEFERQNPGIRVELQQIPWSAAHEKLLTAFAGRVTPDVAQLGSTWVPELVALGALAPLDRRVAATPGMVPRDFFDGSLAANRIGGQLWGIPWYADTRLLFYRSDLLRAAGYEGVPQDWAGWLSAMRAVKARAGTDNYAIFLPVNEFEPLLALGLQQPEPLLRDDGRFGGFRSTGFARASDFYLQLFREGLAPRASNTQISNLHQEFARGRFAMVITGPWNIGEFRSRMPEELQDKWMTAPLPGPDGPGASIAGGASLALFERSANKEAAWKLIDYLSSPAVQLRFFELTGNLPPRRSVWGKPGLASDRHAAAFRNQLERTKAPPAVPEWERIAQTMRIVSERAVAGQITAAEMRAELDVQTDRILEKRRWRMARQAAR